MNPRVSFALICCLICITNQSRGGTMYNLGLLPGGTFNFGGGFGVGAMGLIGVGRGDSGAYTEQPYYWTPSSGIHGIALPFGYTQGNLGRMSTDGGFAVGYVYHPAGVDRAVRWSQAGGIEFIGILPGGDSSFANGISGDGSIIVGSATDSSFHEQAFRWTQAGGMVGLGRLPGFADSSAYNISRNGSFIVGANNNATNSMAFRWTQSSGMVSLGRLPGDLFSEAVAVSGDGSVVVGASAVSFQHEQAFRWTAQTGMVGLGFLPGNDMSEATGITEDGSIIVGNCNLQAFIWDATHGMRDLSSYLQSQGVNVSGWSGLGVENISADGAIMSGLGTYNGTTQAWIAVIPEPNTMNLVLLGLVAGWVWRRR